MQVTGEQNGDRFVTRHEWNTHLSAEQTTVTEIKRVETDHEKRIDKMESKWDRYAGPVVVLLVLMGIISTLASVLGALT